MTENMQYKQSDLPTEERVENLLSQMTLEEKVGQMLQLDGRKNAEQNLFDKHPGSYLQVLDETAAKLQKKALTETRLGIPLLFGIDAIHGHSFWPGATIFPTQIGLSCSWNPELAEDMGRVTAREMAWTGVHWTFSPVLCLARDLRWGRVGETFGEDVLLIGDLASALIRGYQGDDLSARDSVLACAKHFAGYSETQGGRDASEADLSRRQMLSTFLPAFRRAAEAGAATFMTGYQAINGLPCTANRWLLTEVLRDAWGFKGFVVTDWNNVGHLKDDQKVCATLKAILIATSALGVTTKPIGIHEGLPGIGSLHSMLTSAWCVVCGLIVT
ncbi:MAG: glycoside hydrolase family 3 protein [Candidatus Sumerlaeota bacterium]